MPREHTTSGRAASLHLSQPTYRLTKYELLSSLESLSQGPLWLTAWCHPPPFPRKSVVTWLLAWLQWKKQKRGCRWREKGRLSQEYKGWKVNTWAALPGLDWQFKWAGQTLPGPTWVQDSICSLSWGRESGLGGSTQFSALPQHDLPLLCGPCAPQFAFCFISFWCPWPAAFTLSLLTWHSRLEVTLPAFQWQLSPFLPKGATSTPDLFTSLLDVLPWTTCLGFPAGPGSRSLRLDALLHSMCKRASAKAEADSDQLCRTTSTCQALS